MFEKKLIFIFILIMLGINSLPLYSLNSNIEITPVIGFEGSFQSAGYVPVKFFIRNDSNDIDGILKVEGYDMRPGKEQPLVEYAQHILLPKNSYKSFSFILPAKHTGKIRYSIIKNGSEIYSNLLEPRSLPGVSNFVLVLSKSLDFDFISYIKSENPVFLIYMHPDMLPDSWLGYSQASSLILHNIPLTELSERQVKAIDIWSRNGGTVIVVGGSHFGKANYHTLGNLLPAENIPNQPKIKLTDNIQFYNKEGDKLESINDNDIRILNIRKKSGTVLAESNGSPVMVCHYRGAGRIIFSAADFTQEPLRSWKLRAKIWGEILPRDEKVFIPMKNELEFSKNILTLPLDDSRKNKNILPVFFIIAFFMGAAIVLLYFFRTRIIILVTLFCIILGLLTIVMSKKIIRSSEGLLHQISIIELKDNSVVGTGNHSLLIGATRSGYYNISVNKSDILPILDNNNGLVYQNSSSTEIRNIEIPKWTLKSYLFQTTEVFHYEKDINYFNSGIQISFKNNDSRTITDAHFIFQGKTYALGNLAPGGEVVKNLNYIDKPKRKYNSKVESDNRYFQYVVREMHYYFKYDYLHDKNTITLIGLINDSNLEIGTDMPIAESQGNSFLVIPTQIKE